MGGFMGNYKKLRQKAIQNIVFPCSYTISITGESFANVLTYTL